LVDQITHIKQETYTLDRMKLAVLDRMKLAFQNGNRYALPSDDHYAAVLRACTTVNGSSEENA
jgi:hypothetical protein